MSIMVDGIRFYQSHTRTRVISKNDTYKFSGITYLLTNSGNAIVTIEDDIILMPGESWSPPNSGAVPTYYKDKKRILFGAVVGTNANVSDYYLEVSESVIDEVETVICDNQTC